MLRQFQEIKQLLKIAFHN